jgi:hypothetical protein
MAVLIICDDRPLDPFADLRCARGGLREGRPKRQDPASMCETGSCLCDWPVRGREGHAPGRLVRMRSAVVQPVLPDRYTSAASTQRSVCSEAISNSSSLIGDHVEPRGR